MAAASPYQPFPDMVVVNCLMTSEHFDFLLSLPCSTAHSLLMLSFLFHFLSLTFFSHFDCTTCINYSKTTRKKISGLHITLNCCSCQQGDQRDAGDKDESFLCRSQISQHLIVLFRKHLGNAGGGIHFVVIHSWVGCILAKYLCAG